MQNIEVLTLKVLIQRFLIKMFFQIQLLIYTFELSENSR